MKHANEMQKIIIGAIISIVFLVFGGSSEIWLKVAFWHFVTACILMFYIAQIKGTALKQTDMLFKTIGLSIGAMFNFFILI